MSYLSTIRKLYRNLLDALHWINIACKAADRVNAEVQASNASDGLKTTVQNWVTSTHATCDAIEEFKQNLPGNT